MENALPLIVPVLWFICKSSPILKLPAWSVLVYITLPPFSLTTSFAWIVTPPRLGVANVIVFPEPIYSKVCELAIILLCWKKYAVDATPTVLIRFSARVNVVIPETIGV